MIRPYEYGTEVACMLAAAFLILTRRLFRPIGHTYTHTTHMHTHTHAHTHSCTHTTHMHTYMHTHTYYSYTLYTHTHTHTHIHCSSTLTFLPSSLPHPPLLSKTWTTRSSEMTLQVSPRPVRPAVAVCSQTGKTSITS